MCYIDIHEKQQSSYVDDGGSVGGNISPLNSTDSLVATVDFIDCWIKLFDHNYLAQSNLYIETMMYIFLRKSQFKFLKHLVISKNYNHYYMLLEVIGT